MNGVTGRMGTRQHLLRSVNAIIEQGGITISPDEVLMPEVIFVGRNKNKLKHLTEISHVKEFTTELQEALEDHRFSVYFDSQGTLQRFDAVKQAAEAGKHIYCEKPIAITTENAYQLYQICRDAGVKHGVVQDKLYLLGLIKLKRLMQSGFFGEILSVRGEFGYWVFEGHSIAAQRPSWNYRKEEGGGIAVDMLCHWRYVIDNLFGDIQSLNCLVKTHIPERVDEQGQPYQCTADDSAYATFELENGAIVHINSSWNVRVRRDDLLTLQVDGTRGTAVAGLRDVYIQHYGSTPKPVWNPDIKQPINFYENWDKVPEQEEYDNGFKAQWEHFLKYVHMDVPYQYDLLEGVKGVQLAELGLQSSEQRRWLDVPELKH